MSERIRLCSGEDIPGASTPRKVVRREIGLYWAPGGGCRALFSRTRTGRCTCHPLTVWSAGWDAFGERIAGPCGSAGQWRWGAQGPVNGASAERATTPEDQPVACAAGPKPYQDTPTGLGTSFLQSISWDRTAGRRDWSHQRHTFTQKHTVLEGTNHTSQKHESPPHTDTTWLCEVVNVWLCLMVVIIPRWIRILNHHLVAHITKTNQYHDLKPEYVHGFCQSNLSEVGNSLRK